MSVIDKAEMAIANGCLLHNYIIQENDSAATGPGLMISVIWQDAAQVTTALSIILFSEPLIKCMYII
jgi:hypothetical protein